MSETTAWRYDINYGPDGEEDWANLVTPEGQHVANIRTHHARRIVVGLNATAERPPRPRTDLLPKLRESAEADVEIGDTPAIGTYMLTLLDWFEAHPHKSGTP